MDNEEQDYEEMEGESMGEGEDEQEYPQQTNEEIKQEEENA